MKTAEGYMLYNTEGINYLLPVGQNVASKKKGLRLNNTGALLWNAIKNGMKEEDLLSYIATYYGADENELPALRADINSFIRQLTDRHLIYPETEPAECTTYLNIGDLIIGYHGPRHLLHSSLLDFECSRNSVGQHWIIMPQSPNLFPLGELIVRTKEIEIIRHHEDYIITLTPSSPSIQIRVSPDGVNARFYCTSLYSTDHAELLFHAFRHAFLIFAQKQGRFVLHSSSVLYQNKAWLFSAPSGTGKSTQANYWKELFQIRILNGDLNMIWFHSSTPMVSGLPWCGTSKIYNTETHALGGIVLLKKHQENLILELTKTEQSLAVARRLISPAWTEEMLTYNLLFSHKLADQIPVFRFLCRKDPAAAYTLRQYIQQL